MTEREMIHVSETKLRLLESRDNRCEVCGKLIGPYETQLAHRIPQSKRNLKKYGKTIIHDTRNLAVTCGLECNAKVIVHGRAEARLVANIQRDLAPAQGGCV